MRNQTKTNSTFISFEKFNDKASAEQLGKILDTHNIPYVLEDVSANFDPSFANNGFGSEVRIKLQQKDFDEAQNLLLEITKADDTPIPDDYYLLSFTDDELIDVLAKQDEWSPFDFVQAQRLLEQHGKTITPQMLEDMKAERLKEYAKPEQYPKSYIVAGYILALLGGLLGIFMGWHLLTQKKTLPNGDKVYAYSEGDRKTGRNIMFVGIFFLIFWIAVQLYY
jgi:hypothetical protein